MAVAADLQGSLTFGLSYGQKPQQRSCVTHYTEHLLRTQPKWNIDDDEKLQESSASYNIKGKQGSESMMISYKGDEDDNKEKKKMHSTYFIFNDLLLTGHTSSQEKKNEGEKVSLVGDVGYERDHKRFQDDEMPLSLSLSSTSRSRGFRPFFNPNHVSLELTLS